MGGIEHVSLRSARVGRRTNGAFPASERLQSQRGPGESARARETGARSSRSTRAAGPRLDRVLTEGSHAAQRGHGERRSRRFRRRRRLRDRRCPRVRPRRPRPSCSRWRRTSAAPPVARPRPPSFRPAYPSLPDRPRRRRRLDRPPPSPPEATAATPPRAPPPTLRLRSLRRRPSRRTRPAPRSRPCRRAASRTRSTPRCASSRPSRRRLHPCRWCRSNPVRPSNRPTRRSRSSRSRRETASRPRPVHRCPRGSRASRRSRPASPRAGTRWGSCCFPRRHRRLPTPDRRRRGRCRRTRSCSPWPRRRLRPLRCTSRRPPRCHPRRAHRCRRRQWRSTRRASRRSRRRRARCWRPLRRTR